MSTLYPGNEPHHLAPLSERESRAAVQRLQTESELCRDVDTGLWQAKHAVFGEGPAARAQSTARLRASEAWMPAIRDAQLDPMAVAPMWWSRRAKAITWLRGGL